MIGYFPAPFEDELLYSLVSRYHYVSGNKTTDKTLFELFYIQDKNFPSYLINFIQLYKNKIITFNDSNLENININATFIRYNTNLFKNDRHHREIPSKIYDNFTNWTYRFCPKCLEEELENSIPYWHTTHNLPGVTLCLKHNCKLKNSEILLNETELVLLSDNTEGEIIPTFSEKDEKILKKITEESVYIFFTNDNFKDFTSNFIRLVASKGYINERFLCLDKELLQKDFEKFYGENLIGFLNINSEIIGNVFSYFEEGYQIPVIFYILLFILFDSEIKEINGTLFHPYFDSRPRNCRACEIMGLDSENEFYIEGTNLGFIGFQGVYKCECGYGFEVTPRGNNKKNSRLLDEHVYNLFFNQDKKLSDISNELCISKEEVYSIIKGKGLFNLF